VLQTLKVLAINKTVILLKVHSPLECTASFTNLQYSQYLHLSNMLLDIPMEFNIVSLTSASNSK